MKKWLTPFLVLQLALSMLVPVYADTETVGIPVDSPWYGFKKLFEAIELFFASGDYSRAETAMRHAETRLAEVQDCISRGQEKHIEGLMKEYADLLNISLSHADNTKDLGLIWKIGNATLKHQAVLQRNLEKAPEPAKKGLQNAINASIKGHQQALESHKKAKKK